MSATLDMFSKPPRRSPRVMMHMIDAGQGCCPGIHYRCDRCGHSEWIWYDDAPSRTQAERGEPCPKCNEGA